MKLKLKLLVVLRHGLCEGRGFLTPEGRIQIQALALRLKQDYGLDPAMTMFLCSRELRTLKTVQCLMQTLGFHEQEEEMCHQSLFSSDSECNPQPALGLVKQFGEKFENLIVVTHQEMASELPRVFCTQVLDIQTPLHFRAASHGQGFAIDVATNTCEIIM